MSPTVSVLVPCYLDGDHLQGTIESILSQSWQDLELVISDEGADTRCRQIVEALDDSRIRYFCNDRRLGMNRNWNTALARSRGNYIIKVDADDVMTAGTLARLMQALERNPAAGFAGCLTRDCDANLQNCRLYGSRGFELAGLKPENDCLLTPRNIFHHLFADAQLWSSCSMLLRRNCIEVLGGWDERWQASDTDIILRTLIAGYAIAHCGHVGILYRRREGSESETARKTQDQFALENAMLNLIAIKRWQLQGGLLSKPLRIAWCRYWDQYNALLKSGAQAKPETREMMQQVAGPPWPITGVERLRLLAYRLFKQR